MKARFLFILLVLVSIGKAATVGGDTSSKIFAAIRNGDRASVQVLAYVNGNVTNAEGETPLMYAALYGDASTVKMLLARGADVN